MLRISHNPLLIVFCLAGLLAGCGGQQSNTGSIDGQSDSLFRPDSEVSGATIYLYNKGRVTSQIISEKMFQFEQQDSLVAYKLDIDIYDSTGLVSTEVTGDSGIIREDRGLLNIYGNVVVVTDDSTRLETEYLWWDSNTDRIKTDAFVRITRGDDVITGWGLDADNRLKDFKILSQVSGTLSDPEKLQDEK
ncbi:MAG: LPS export ABC transporter periplasmic protein LptC [Candidatus Zixiibacteriota bacterium]|nr:MAG: LPS export ABC transporter periplasmic protein LptC [candidate division Zixibacteria bacterium]